MRRHIRPAFVTLLTLASAAAAVPALAGPETSSIPQLTRSLAYHLPLASSPAEDLHLRLVEDGLKAAKGDAEALKALTAFYAARDWQPAWTDAHGLNAVGRTLADRIALADTDGLEPSDYPLPPKRIARDQLADAELTLSRALLAYAHDAQGGRIDPSRVSGYVKIEPTHPDPLKVLASLARSKNPAGTLAAFNPPHEGYRRLRMKLADLRRAKSRTTRPPRIAADGPTMRLGLSDPRVPLLRQRLGVTLSATRVAIADTVRTDTPIGKSADTLFDDDLDAAVRQFQREAGLAADGVVGPNTLAVLNREADADPVADIVANMERWRWLPRDLGRFHVFVNIPEFLVRIVDNGTITHTTRVVVGKRGNQTPIFSDEMEHLVVNPYWNVPYSIASKEMLRGIQADPGGYLSRRGYEAVYNGRVVDPTSINWSPANLRKVRIRQRPSARNALGRIKFMFPNKYSIYLHDTPSKSLFQRAERAYSHGCVRVHNPVDFADALLAHDSKWNGKRIAALFGGAERRIDLTPHIPVHLVYFTTTVDATGKLHSFGDIYGHNKKLKTLLASARAAN